eukprot:TRINITY_DN1648_c0_g1_i2.p1 TRINITY_DN1648_c0_g1~~TRINITY_DN1648_c0_g1_i2.p1  ORF type:complete len:457 (+),score=73.26 TRINITY_DN1648_c0_g1_i2:730-2100(+)
MGSMLPKPVTTKVLERKDTKLFQIGVGFMNGYREKMEDAHTVMPIDDEGWGFFGVFDGHCGPLCSKYVADRFPKLIPNYSIPIPDDKLRDLSVQIDNEFLSTMREGGSTGTFMFIKKDGEKYHLQVANVGDSRIVLGRKRDRSEHSLTEDHKPGNIEERARIEAAGGMVQNNRVDGSLAVSRAFGDASYKSLGPHNSKVIAVPEIVHCDAEPGDFVLLACDGVFENDVFTNTSVIEFIFQQLEHTSDLATISATICDEAMLRGSKDNISAMIVQLGNNGSSGLPEQEVRAGPMAVPSNTRFVSAYETMCEEAGLTLERCLELRFDQVNEMLRVQYKEKNYRAKICDLKLLTDSDLLYIAKANNLEVDVYSLREDKIARLTHLKETRHDADFRTPLIRQLELEIINWGVPEEIEHLPPGSEKRTNWFRTWIDGIAKQDTTHAKLDYVKVAHQLLSRV